MEKEKINYLTERLWVHEIGSCVTLLSLILMYFLGYFVAFYITLVLFILSEISFAIYLIKKEKEFSL